MPARRGWLSNLHCGSTVRWESPGKQQLSRSCHRKCRFERCNSSAPSQGEKSKVVWDRSRKF